RRNASSCKHCKQQVLYYKESEQAIRHLKKCAPFQELRHQFAFVYPFSDVLPLYNQKIYAKDTAKKRVKTDPTHASVKVKLKVKPKSSPSSSAGGDPDTGSDVGNDPKGKESMESESGMRVLTRYASFEEKNS
ncbi:hypothetical protein PF010_g33402, partial [Phytophthora fragariae]